MINPTLIVCRGSSYTGTDLELKHNTCMNRGLLYLYTPNCVREDNSTWNKPANHQIDCSVGTCLILRHVLGVRARNSELVLVMKAHLQHQAGMTSRTSIFAPAQLTYRKRVRDRFNHISDWLKSQLVMMYDVAGKRYTLKTPLEVQSFQFVFFSSSSFVFFIFQDLVLLIFDWSFCCHPGSRTAC